LAGDSHIANVESACWFVREVFQPHLAVRGFSLAVVGRLSDALHARIGAVPYVYYVGFVDDLSRVRRLSRVVVLPDRRGTGISIKTLEAFASGMPFVATSVALRGLRARLPKDFNSFDEPADFAAEVLELLGHPDAAKQSSERAREAYRLLASGPRFDRAWDRVLQNLGFASPNLASHPSPGSSRSGDVAVGDVHVVD
jgi:glycosyltransferase involved in cell wall biosynthesis